MLFHYFLSFVRRNTGKTLLLIASVATSLAAAIILMALSTALPTIAALPFHKIGIGAIVQKTGKIPAQMTGAIFPHSNGPIYPDSLARITDAAFVQRSDTGLYFWYFDTNRFASAFGINNNGGTFATLLRKNIANGTFDLAPNRALITADFARKTKKTVGDTVSFGTDTFTITGILRDRLSGNIIPADIYLTIDDARRIARNSAEMQRLYAFTDAPFVNVIALNIDPQWHGDPARAITAQDKQFLVFSQKTFSKEVTDQLALVSVMGRVFFLAFGIILLMTFALLMSYMTKTRAPEIATLRMIGWSTADLRRQFITESAIILAVAIVVGNLLALMSLLLLRLQTVSLALPWEISAKPHFLPQENAIDRTLTVPLPITLDWMHFVMLSLLFFVLFGIINTLIFRRFGRITPSDYLS